MIRGKIHTSGHFTMAISSFAITTSYFVDDFATKIWMIDFLAIRPWSWKIKNPILGMRQDGMKNVKGTG